MFDSLYNQMALIIRTLLTHTDETFYESYRALADKKRISINKELSAVFPELINAGNAVKLIDPFIDLDMENRIQTYVNECEKRKKWAHLVHLLSKLDLGLQKNVAIRKVDLEGDIVLNAEFSYCLNIVVVGAIITEIFSAVIHWCYI